MTGCDELYYKDLYNTLPTTSDNISEDIGAIVPILIDFQIGFVHLTAG
jgi:hypothetical protein